MFEEFTASLQQFGNFSAEQLSAMLPRVTVLNINKDEMLIKEGQLCRAFYFINKGGFRHYTILETGEESTINLFIKNEWMLEYKSFITQQPSQNIIQAVTDSEVVALSVHDFHELVKISDCFFRLGGICNRLSRTRISSTTGFLPNKNMSTCWPPNLNYCSFFH